MPTKKSTENLPAIPTTGFQLVVADQDEVTIPEELAAAIQPEDHAGYEEAAGGLPIVTIRQKPLCDESGAQIMEAGSFRYRDPAFPNVDDVSGKTGLLVSVLKVIRTRTLWEENQPDRPACKSIDGGNNGMGKPGGKCATCSRGQFKEDNSRPDCNEGRALLVYDHNMNGSIYVLQLGPSGIKPYSNFQRVASKLAVNGVSVPLMVVQARVSLRYEANPKPHFVPEFKIEGLIDVDLIQRFRGIRSEMSTEFSSAIDKASDVNDDQPSQSNNNGQVDEFDGGLTIGQRVEVIARLRLEIHKRHPDQDGKDEYHRWAVNEGLISYLDLDECTNSELVSLEIRTKALNKEDRL